MTRIAAPDYVNKHALSGCPPGHRFSLYFPLWNGNWSIDDKEGAKSVALKKGLGLGEGRELLDGLRLRQRALAQALPETRRLVIDAVATAPFATGLGNAHPVENGFAFLTPYGLPYLAGSGVKGVLRRAAQLLRDERAEGFTDEVIDALFGPGNPGADGSGPKLAEADRRRGALTCWDVFPEPHEGQLALEIMTPHHGAYYEGRQSPHDAGQPMPIPFLALPVGSGLRFVLSFEPPLWSLQLDWHVLADVALRHAFDWLGFGAKTALGYGAMAEEGTAREQRLRDAAARREASEAAERERRRASMNPEQIEAEEASARVAAFRQLLDAEKTTGRYKPGSPFDQHRASFLKQALDLRSQENRTAAAKVLRESYKFTAWPAKAERKLEVKQWLTQLDGQA